MEAACREAASHFGYVDLVLLHFAGSDGDGQPVLSRSSGFSVTADGGSLDSDDAHTLGAILATTTSFCILLGLGIVTVAMCKLSPREPLVAAMRRPLSRTGAASTPGTVYRGVKETDLELPPHFLEVEDGKFAGTMFKWHTWMGQYIFYLLPVHVGAVGLHTFKGQPILSRINPFASPK